MSEVAVMPLEDYKNACNSIRAKTGKTDLITSGQMSAEIDGIDTDKSLPIWNAITNNGNRTHCTSMFENTYAAGTTWNFDIITPPYLLKPTNAASMFRQTSITKNTEDLSEWMSKYLDLSECKNVNGCFRDSDFVGSAYHLRRVGVLDLRKVTDTNGAYGMFYNAQARNRLETIDEIKFSESMNFDALLLFCTSLRNCVFTGTITTSQSLTYSPLSAASVRSLISCLTNYTGTENEFANTLTLTETAWANVNADTDNPPPSGADWREYVMSLGWTA